MSFSLTIRIRFYSWLVNFIIVQQSRHSFCSRSPVPLLLVLASLGSLNQSTSMKRIVALFLVVAATASNAISRVYKGEDGECNHEIQLVPRPHSVSILEFGAVGDGKTVNTVAFQNAIFYLKSFADKGGAQLYVPSGKWVIGSFSLTSHLTLFLQKEAIILGSQDMDDWKVIDSYGQRYSSLINGENLNDVVITGDNGVIDGQGSVWWETETLNYSRPHIVECINCEAVVVSNITFLNPPSWAIHPVYCSNVVVKNITALSPAESPYTSGLVPDSCDGVCIENSYISMGHDAISLKSRWDRPTRNVHLKGVRLQSFAGSALGFGSEMSGGISNVIVENVKVQDSVTGIGFLTSKGRGGYIKDVVISDVNFDNVGLAIKVMGEYDDDDVFPVIKDITFKSMVGVNISSAGRLFGIRESPFTSICLSNISLALFISPSSSSSSAPWLCSNVFGFSENVSPTPCFQLQTSPWNSSACFPWSTSRIASI